MTFVLIAFRRTLLVDIFSWLVRAICDVMDMNGTMASRSKDSICAIWEGWIQHDSSVSSQGPEVVHCYLIALACSSPVTGSRVPPIQFDSPRDKTRACILTYSRFSSKSNRSDDLSASQTLLLLQQSLLLVRGHERGDFTECRSALRGIRTPISDRSRNETMRPLTTTAARPDS